MHTHDNVKVIPTSINLNKRKELHLLAIYKPLTMCLINFLHILTKFYIKAHQSCHTHFIEDFNVAMLSISTQPTKIGTLYETLHF